MRRKKVKQNRNRKVREVAPEIRNARGPSRTHTSHIFCDGSCVPNPGAAASSCVIYEGRRLLDIRHGLFDPEGTNNTAELEALRLAFTLVRELDLHDVEVLSNSKYALESVRRAVAWTVHKKVKQCRNVGLILKTYRAYSAVKDRVSLSFIPRRTGAEGNQIADFACKRARIHEIADIVSLKRELLIEALDSEMRQKSNFLESIFDYET